MFSLLWGRWSATSLFAISCLLLSGCGGLSKEDSDESFTVNAGRDRTVAEQSAVSLTAQVSYAVGDVVYTWSATPSLTITHDDTTASTASLTSPEVTTETLYVITISATDSTGQTTSDSFTLTVTPENIAPTAIITLATWPEQPAGTYPAGVEITLDGRSSTDSDSTSNAPIADWLWQQTAGDDVLTGVETDQSTLVIATPIADVQQSMTFSLTVTDQEGAEHSTSYSFTVLSAADTPPEVSVGQSQALFSGERIVLAGEATSTVPAAYPMDILWTYSGDIEPLIVNASTADTYAVAPAVETETTLEFYLSAVDTFGNEVTESVTMTIRPFPVRVLNDTGMTSQANATAIGDTQQNAWPGQDGQRGADVLSDSGVLDKAGRGEAGFDFTKLNVNGDEQDVDATEFSCVRDNVTGLVWEIKTTDGGLRDFENTYSWYAEEDNGGAEGDLNGSATSCTLTNCNTEDYIDAINTDGLCGFYDWRLPTHQELMSLIHFGRTEVPRVDTHYFPNAGDDLADELWYWTAQPSADGVSGDAAQNAWAIDFISGVDNFLNKSSASYVRLVRAGR